MKYSMLCIMLLAASPLTAQNQSKTMDDGCRPIPIGGGVSIWPENDCAPLKQYNIRDAIREQRRDEVIRIPNSCKVEERKVHKKTREVMLVIKCAPIRPVVVIRDDYGRPRDR
jgi:hypothetical protein